MLRLLGKQKLRMKQTSTSNLSSKFASQNPNSIQDSYLNELEILQWEKIRQALGKELKAPSATSLRIIREHSIRTSHLLEA
jgi:hypothetical protein